MSLFPASSSGETVIIKAINKSYSNVSFGASGEASAPAPSTPTGYTFLSATPVSYSGTAYGAISYISGYLQGPVNKSFSSIAVRFVYIKTEYLEISSV